jgi:enamine deaminase RidA (YjgF/YER057c/UK114 family)
VLAESAQDSTAPQMTSNGKDYQRSRSARSDQCRQAFANLASVLKAAGADLADVVKATIFFTDLDNLATINRVWG